MRRYLFKLSKFLKMGKVSKVLNCLPKVIIFLMWKEAMRFRWFPSN